MAGHILVVDDEEDFAATYRRLLRREGYRVSTAGSREEGLEAIEHDCPALVISDLRLPDGDGLDVVRAARATATPTPVIVVTAFVSDASRTATLAAGASAYVAKPFSTAALTSLVRRVLGAPLPKAE